MHHRPASLASAMLLSVVAGCAAPMPVPSVSIPVVPSMPGPATASPAPAAPAPTPVTPSGSPATPSPAPVPSTPPPDLARVAETERDAIRLRVVLQRNPMPAGERSWVRVTVTNTGDSPIKWYHDGCALPGTVYGESQVAWPMGVDHDDQAGMFKTYALGGHIVQPPSPHARISFVRRRALLSGAPGCADLGISERIAPGGRRTITLWWSGSTDGNRALPPAGPMALSAWAGHYWRGRHGGVSMVNRVLRVSIPAWITTDAPPGLSPAEAVDAAIADPAFAAYLDTQAIANGRAEIAWYDRRRDRWEIGVMPWHEGRPPRIHGVLVDATTGEVIGELDRPWRRAVDPHP